MTATAEAVASPGGAHAGHAGTRRGSTLAGTGALVRFILRRDRVRLPVWIVSLTLLVLTTAASVKGLYPTQADLEAGAEPMYDNVAAVALNGPTYGIDTYGGQIVFQIGSFGYAAVALMGMFLVGRHTRADEETGRTELLRATVVGRNAPVTAVLVVMAGAFALLGTLIALSVAAQDVPAGGAWLYGAAMGGFGFAFACLTAVTVQLAEHNRAALGLAGVALGAAYLLRAVGDIGNGVLSWLSPMGWAQYTKPFAGDRWWPLLLLAAAAAALVATAFGLLSRRDLGGGLVPPRPGPAHAAESLGRPLGLATRLQRAALVAWAAGLVATGVAYGSIGQDVEDFIGDNESFRDMIAQAGGDLTDSYFATSLEMIALIAGGFAISSTLRLRSEESAGRAEPLLVTGIGRARWAASHLVVALAGSAAVMLAAGGAMAVTHAAIAGDAGEAWPILGATVALVPALWVLVGLAFALFGLVPRWSAAAWAVLAGAFVIGVLGELLELPGAVMALSPYHHVPAMPAEGFDPPAAAGLLAVAAAALAAGFAGFRRRDAGV
ncbi:MAG TPA: hypothetical protein VFZ77_12810 [Acidimicrobiales bacterium]